jgi:hypothetical protein
VAFIVTLASLSAPVSAGHSFMTPKGSFITLSGAGTVLPIISVGETYHGFLFEGIPDGIGIAPGPRSNTVNVFVNHEQSRVPFRDRADFLDASVSKLTLDTTDGKVVGAEVVIEPAEGYIRFCSAFMAGPAEGFSRYTFFTGEESNDDLAVPPGAQYGPDPAIAPQREAGYAVVLDAKTGAFTQVAGMGRLNHENQVVIPGGWRGFSVLTTDDTFSAPSSQLYLYRANRESHIWKDKGSLWAFRVTRTDSGPVNPNDPFNNANDYLDLGLGDDWKGEFIRVPKKIARGLTGVSPQQALEDWSNDHNVFQFIRLEDLAYDRNNPRIVYVADTGASRVVPDDETGRMKRPDGVTGQADNGRIFKFVFNKRNPRKVDSFSVFADGDAPMTAPEFVPMRAPDNMDTSANSLMVQEDTSNAKIWQYDFGGGTWTEVATVNDSSGESSGIVDASEWFGAGWWLLDVQVHGRFVEQEQVGDVLFKREDGQLLLMEIPGS